MPELPFNPRTASAKSNSVLVNTAELRVLLHGFREMDADRRAIWFVFLLLGLVFILLLAAWSYGGATQPRGCKSLTKKEG